MTYRSTQDQALTLFENLQVAELQQVIPVVEVSDIYFVIIRLWILHPSSFIPAKGVVSYWFRDGRQSVLTLPCKESQQVRI